MYFKFASAFFVIFCLLGSLLSAPVEKDDEEDEAKEEIQLLDGAFQMQNEDEAAFKYELSDGNMREETIKKDDLDNGIAVRGSYSIELADGEMQTIYYISDVNGHRISINKPFPEEEINRPRIAPNWRENEEKERLAYGRSIDVESKAPAAAQNAAPAVSAQKASPAVAVQKASPAVVQKASPAVVQTTPVAEKERFTQPTRAIPTRLSKVRERPRVASLPDRPKNVEFKDDHEEDSAATEDPKVEDDATEASEGEEEK